MTIVRWVRVMGVGWVAGLAIVLLGCGNGDDNVSAVPIADSGSPTVDASHVDSSTTASDAASTDARSAEAAAPTGTPAEVRIANWASGAPQLDFCLSPAGANTFAGPALQTAFAGYDAGTIGVPYPGASAYVSVAAGTYDVLIVQAGAPNCGLGVGPPVMGRVVAGGSFTTVALLPATGTAWQTLALSDDESVSSGIALVRFVNALPSAPSGGATEVNPTVDFGTGSVSGASMFKAIFAGVTFGQASAKANTTAGGQTESTASADKNGYASITPVGSGDLSAHVSGDAGEA